MGLGKWLLLAGSLLGTCSAVFAGEPPAVAPAPATNPVPLATPEGLKKLAFAHYTAWHHPADTSLSVSKYYNFPWLHSTGVLKNDYRIEIEMAIASGIDGFFVDIVGKGTGNSSNYVGNMKQLCDAAAGTSFVVGPCLDVAYPDLDWQVSELARMFQLCLPSPNFATVNGRPVVITYSCLQRKPEEWRQIREGLRKQGHEIYLIANLCQGFKRSTRAVAEAYAKEFDMLYSFGEYGIGGQTIREVFDMLSATSRANGRAWMPTIHPGYLGAWWNGRNDYYQPHRGLDQILDCWLAIQPGQSDWVHLTTWNDHDETSLMPMSFDFGSASQINRAFIDRLKGNEYRTDTPDVVFAYHREELAGTVWRLEAVSLPCKDMDYAEVSGALLGMDGSVLAELPARTLNLRDFDRTEWNIPTAALAVSAAVRPVVQVVALKDGKEQAFAPRRLPALLIKTGWIQNQVTVRFPYSKASEQKAALQVTQDGSLLTARLEAALDEPVVSAHLWRNDRPLGVFSPKAESSADAAMGELNLWFAPLASVPLRLEVEQGKLLDANLKMTDDAELEMTETSLKTPEVPNWAMGGLRLLATPQTILRIGWGKNEEEVAVADLLRQHTVALPQKKPLFQLEVADCDVGLLRHAPLSADAAKTPLALSVQTRDSRPNDLFTARLETASGKVVFADFTAPFAASDPVENYPMQETCVNLETKSGASGMPGATEFLFVPPLRNPKLTEAPVHPAALRACRWTFEHGGADDLGDFPIRTAKSLVWKQSGLIVDGGAEGSGKCLKLDGKTQIELRLRAYPLAACTIDFSICPDAIPTERQRILGRSGWTGGFNFYLGADGQIEVVRNGGDATPVTKFASGQSIPAGAWSRVTLRFDETSATLYLNGQPTEQVGIPLCREYGNCTPSLGAEENGFAGLIDNVTFLSWPTTPDDPVFTIPATAK